MDQHADSVHRLWAAYTRQSPGVPDSFQSWYFADNQTDADNLVELVLSGAKRATAGALWAYEADGEPLPRPGDHTVVTDWAGNAKCIISTTAVDVVPYNAVREDFAAAEGEGDLSLDYWRKVHWPYFSREMQRIGRQPMETMPVVCHRFEVVYPR